MRDSSIIAYEPHHEKKCLSSFITRPNTKLAVQPQKLNFGFRKQRDYTMW